MDERQVNAEDKPVFDKGRVDLGINAVCGKLDELGLTLLERFWVAHCIGSAAAGLLGMKYSELAEKMTKENTPIDVEPVD